MDRIDQVPELCGPDVVIFCARAGPFLDSVRQHELVPYGCELLAVNHPYRHPPSASPVNLEYRLVTEVRWQFRSLKRPARFRDLTEKKETSFADLGLRDIAYPCGIGQIEHLFEVGIAFENALYDCLAN